MRGVYPNWTSLYSCNLSRGEQTALDRRDIIVRARLRAPTRRKQRIVNHTANPVNGEIETGQMPSAKTSDAAGSYFAVSIRITSS